MAGKRRIRGRSIRGSLFRIIVLATMIPLMLGTYFLMSSARRKVIQTTSVQIQSQVLVLSNQLKAAAYFDGTEHEGADLLIEQIADLIGGRIQIISAGGTIIKDTFLVDTGKYNISEHVLWAFSKQTYTELSSDGTSLTIGMPILEKVQTAENTTEGENETVVLGVILANADLGSEEAAFARIRMSMFLLWGIVLLLAFAAAVVLLRNKSKQLAGVAQAAEAVADGNMKTPAAFNRYSETARISDALNRIDRHQREVDESRQQFVSNVAHELKTPITSIRVLADSLTGMGDNVSMEMYKEFISDISSEINRESLIIDDLLSISRLDNKNDKLEVAKVDLNEWLEITLKRLTPIAKQRNVEVLLESYRSITADIDETKLTLAVSNVVENSIKYNHEKGWVRVSLNADLKYFYLKISDSGCGIPEAAIPHVFERFFRVDRDRSRETGGTGLGLPIARTIVNLHHGDIKVYSKAGEGTTVEMRIPLVFFPEEDDV